MTTFTPLTTNQLNFLETLFSIKATTYVNVKDNFIESSLKEQDSADLFIALSVIALEMYPIMKGSGDFSAKRTKFTQKRTTTRKEITESILGGNTKGWYKYNISDITEENKNIIWTKEQLSKLLSLAFKYLYTGNFVKYYRLKRIVSSDLKLLFYYLFEGYYVTVYGGYVKILENIVGSNTVVDVIREGWLRDYIATLVSPETSKINTSKSKIEYSTFINNRLSRLNSETVNFKTVTFRSEENDYINARMFNYTLHPHKVTNIVYPITIIPIPSLHKSKYKSFYKKKINKYRSENNGLLPNINEVELVYISKKRGEDIVTSIRNRYIREMLKAFCSLIPYEEFSLGLAFLGGVDFYLVAFSPSPYYISTKLFVDKKLNNVGIFNIPRVVKKLLPFHYEKSFSTINIVPDSIVVNNEEELHTSLLTITRGLYYEHSYKRVLFFEKKIKSYLKTVKEFIVNDFGEIKGLYTKEDDKFYKVTEYSGLNSLSQLYGNKELYVTIRNILFNEVVVSQAINKFYKYDKRILTCECCGMILSHSHLEKHDFILPPSNVKLSKEYRMKFINFNRYKNIICPVCIKFFRNYAVNNIHDYFELPNFKKFHDIILTYEKYYISVEGDYIKFYRRSYYDSEYKTMVSHSSHFRKGKKFTKFKRQLTLPMSDEFTIPEYKL